jgi:hypothetical protein
VRKTRQEIYSRLATNITQRVGLLERIQRSPEWKNAKSYQEQYDVAIKDAALSKNLSDQKEIAALLCMFGTDDAVKAYADWLREGWDPNTKAAKSADLGRLILVLRKSIYPETYTIADDANLVIWNDVKHLDKPPPAR